MWARATNSENWLPKSQFIAESKPVFVTRIGGSEIHERVAQLFIGVHTSHFLDSIPKRSVTYEQFHPLSY